MNGEYEQTIKKLEEVSDNPYLVVQKLSILITYPIADKRMIRLLENLCVDKRITQLGVPASYAEVRYVAAYTLRAHYEILGIDAVVYLPRVLRQLSNQNVFALYKETVSSELPLGFSGLDAYKMLAEMGKIPTRPMALWPHVK